MSSMSDDEVAKALYRACADGDLERLRSLLDNEPYTINLIDITNKRDPPKAVVEKTIYNACLKGHFSIVKQLLRANINPNARCEFGTPLYAAVTADSLEIVKLLMDHGAQYKRVIGGFSPLFAACVEGRMKILRYLVNAGADLLFIKNPPLVFTACMQGHLEIFEYLLEETEFNINLTINGDDAGRVDGKDSLLYIAASSKRLEIAESLLQRGALVTQTIISKFPDFIKDLLGRRVKPSSRGATSGGPLLFTARWKELGLSEVPWNFLSAYVNRLAKLELRGNHLSSLPEEIFQMPSLNVLDVSQNQLAELSQEVVEWKCSHLNELDASKNQIVYAPSGAFTLPSLTVLNLSYNLLRRLPGDPEDASPHVRWKCEVLKRLDLSHNRLRTLPDTFKNLRRLNTLVVSYNYLHELPPSLGLGCINLVHLDASHNTLKCLPLGSANFWMHCLERLYLSHNEIEEISSAITELSHLTTLDLSHNRIQHLPLTSSWTNARMIKLSLAFNQLSRLSHTNESDQTYTRTNANPSGRDDRDRVPTIARIIGKKKKEEKVVRAPQPTKSLPDNNPRELPVDSWSNTLQSLYLQNNTIEFLPNYIGKLTSLARLDISQNTSINRLPLTLGQLKNCWELIMHGLSISNVPKHHLPGIGRGASTKHLIAYLKAQLKNSEPYNRMKLMAVGLQGRGKTTLLSVLRDSSAPLPPNVSTVGVTVNKWVLHPKPTRGQQQSPRQLMDVVFSMWDLAGQEVYYATHQCFLSRNTLYLLVWNMTEGEKGIDYLRPWLLNVQSRAPKSPVIIVGTHLDKIPSNQVNELRQLYKSKILDSYGSQGYPTIHDICMVSCVTHAGIKELQDRIHSAAISAKDPDTHEYVIGMQVPASYILLQNMIEDEAKKLKDSEHPPVLNQKEFAALAEKTNDIADPEELTLAAQFLHDNGIILHYNDHLKGLNNLYFIDSVWLADMLAHIITVPQRQNFAHNGLLMETHLKFIFRDNKNYPVQYLPQYMQLLERFEIALSLGQGTLLIPSMLPEQRPALPFAMPLPKTKRQPNPEPRVIRKDTLMKGCSSTDVENQPEEEEEDEESITKMVDGKLVANNKVTCVRRRYKMAYIPSGFWSRLISRLMINLKRSGLVDYKTPHVLSDPNIIYWRRGILIIYATGRFLVEAIQSPLSEVSGVAISQSMITSNKFIGGGIDSNAKQIQGVGVTVWSDSGDFSAIGYVVDQLDSLIDEWFPGLNDLDIDGEWLVERQALWVVPNELKPPLYDEELQLDQPFFSDPVLQDVYIFKLEDCALKALQQDTIFCSDYNIYIPLSSLVPDLLMTDLPSNMKIDLTQFDFNPSDMSTRLGRGGAGAVYRGKYRNESVAIKEFLTQSQAEAFGDDDGQAAQTVYREEDTITAGEALFLYRDMRQEVTVLAQLSHPNIVSLLGISLRPMCIALELAPMGSLFGILDKKLEAIKAAQADLPTSTIRMPGGVLGHEISARIALQVALATRYLHKKGIVYRDLKSDNVLIWNLEVDSPFNAKLADYGISRFANPGGIKGEEGTPGYMAPEAIRRRGEDQAFDEKVDIFSFGMLLFELITGQRPFESMTSGQEVNRAVLQRERPPIQEGNTAPSFPGLVDLMEDCWRHLAAERPTADEVVQRISAPGFLCRRHVITRVKEHPLQKIDTVYSQPLLTSKAEDDPLSCMLWTWSRQDIERNYSILNTHKGVFTLPEKLSPGGRVFAMATTGEVEKRLWIATSVARNYPDFEIQVFGFKPPTEPSYLWSFIVRDSVLDMTTDVEEGRVKRVFASLANGTICIFSRKSISTHVSEMGQAKTHSEACLLKCEDTKYKVEAEDWDQPLVLSLSDTNKAIKCMTFVGKDHLWCGCGNSITIVNVSEMKVVNTIKIFARRAQLVNELVSNGKKVWSIGRQLSSVMELDVETQRIHRVLDCSRVDPTGNVLLADPSTVEELVLVPNQQTTEEISPSASPQTVDQIDDDSTNSSNDSGGTTTATPTNNSGFQISNEPQNPSRTSNSPYNQQLTRKTLKTFRKPRTRVYNISHKDGASIFASRPEDDALKRAKVRSMLRQQGATRVTSLLIVDDTLWVGRGMGDVLVIDIKNNIHHGTALARLSTEDADKYGNRSNHKLCLVSDKYVVSSQWLEPLDMTRPRAITNADSSGSFSENEVSAHQQITIWEAWNYDKLQLNTQRINDMLDIDDQALN